ncbi:hypothetical protein BLOT_012980 [Blomia tropicalis]|nr:hypothetical protein BLOT_012980 [Blomia tropicalis]
MILSQREGKVIFELSNIIHKNCPLENGPLSVPIEKHKREKKEEQFQIMFWECYVVNWIYGSW